MSPQPVSPFTIDHLAAMLDAQSVAYVRDMDAPALLVNVGCARVPHALRMVVDVEHGYLSIAHHDMLVLSGRVATNGSIGEACRFALLMNGDAVFGGFMLYDYQGINIGFCAMVPTAGALLSSDQVEQTVTAVCALIDRAFPLLQQVLWGRMSADDAHELYRNGLPGADEGAVPEPGDDQGPGGAGFGSEEFGPTSPAAIDQLDDQFLAEHDPGDPFSAALAAAIRASRTIDRGGIADSTRLDDSAS